MRGFGGIGGMLRWKVDFQDLEIRRTGRIRVLTFENFSNQVSSPRSSSSPPLPVFELQRVSRTTKGRRQICVDVQRGYTDSVFGIMSTLPDPSVNDAPRQKK